MNLRTDKDKYNFNIAEVIVIMIITLTFGVLIGGVGLSLKDKTATIGSSSELKELITTYKDILKNYYGDVDEDKLLESGIKGMITYLNDPYSSYLDAEIASEYNETLEGKYVGLGVEILNDEDGNFKIVTVFEDGPADKCGIKVGDYLIKVGNTEVEGKNTTELSQLIKGVTGTSEKVTVLRDNKEIEMTFIRSSVDLSSVSGQVIEKDNKKVAYIKISVFAQNSYEQFKKTYSNLKKENTIDYMIIDLRNNTGGYLTSLKDILSMFLNKKDVLYYTGIEKAEDAIKCTTVKEIDMSVAVLINGRSASASEVMALSLKENNQSILVGTESYGKGTVQKTTKLSSGASIKYTVEKWWSPSKKNIDGEGIVPDYAVELESGYNVNIDIEDDTQLQKAMEVLISNKK